MKILFYLKLQVKNQSFKFNDIFISINMIQEYEAYVNLMKKQYKYWMIASAIIYSCVITFIVLFDFVIRLDSKIIWWSIISILLMVSMNWWYWTMSLVKQLMEHHTNSIKVIKSLISDINAVRSDLTDIDKFD